MTAMAAAPHQPVRRRHVFFFSGFDPKGGAYYHHLYATGAAQQQGTTGHVYQVGGRERTDDRYVQRWRVGWRANAAEPVEQVATTVEYWVWDDLVRTLWPKTVVGVALGSVRAYAAALRSVAALRKVWQQSPRTLVALAYPALFWLLALLGGLLLGGLAAQLGGFAAARSGWPSGVATAVAGALALAACLAVWWGAWWLEQRLHTSWLLRIYRFTELWASGKLPDLDQRLDAVAERVLQRLRQQDADEVLLVGFSVGSMLSASVLARVLKQSPDIGRLSMLTLGQCIPLLGLAPGAHRFREQLALLAATPTLCWTDYSSPSDWGSFALVDPLQICSLTLPGPPGPGTLRPSMRSPRFHTLFEAAEYARIKPDKRRMHLQYLMATPKAGAYDYFLMTAGPWRLCAQPGSSTESTA